MMKKNKTQIIVSSIVTILPMVAGLFMWNILPDRMTTHWGMSGEADGFSSKAFAVFVLPLILLATHWLCIFFTLRDPKNKEQSSKVFAMIMWIIPITSLITNGMVYAVSLGSAVGIDIAVRVLLGLMFIILGNYLPKCKQNHTIGVKVSWALQNEENWNKTHRFTGRLWVAGGVILLATLFIPMEDMMGLFLTVILLLSFVPMLYSYLYYRKQVKEGTYSKEKKEEDPKVKEWEKKMVVISAVISVPLMIFVVVLLFTGDITVEFTEDSFTVDSIYWEDMTVGYEQIASIEYREQDNSGTRTFGFGSLKLEMGAFENEEFGAYTRYSYIDCESCVVITSAEGEVLVISGEDDSETKGIYEELSARMRR
ncbi:MAG: DUF1648 domain-containing protein [Lachnospiraceae bacterium]|nr:DUF1648 domain-containing protein [Lachnospiraceae bacterium]